MESEVNYRRVLVEIVDEKGSLVRRKDLLLVALRRLFHEDAVGEHKVVEKGADYRSRREGAIYT